ncbi:metal-dependent hydrolase [Geodermatophilus pulveris]|nr:metal-dependent hydrolase [Geodermatophilus pulveris]
MPRARWTKRAVTPTLALLAIGLLDSAAAIRPWPLPVVGLLDEPAHLLTAWLFLAASPWARRRLDLRWVLLGAVAIDVDHLPLYLWGALASSPGGRPVTHSLITVLVLLVVAALSRRLRTAATGVAVGVLLHFVRDVATGPGLPLAWPLCSGGALLPYGLYIGVVAAVTALAVARRVHAFESRSPRSGGVRGQSRRPPTGDTSRT